MQFSDLATLNAALNLLSAVFLFMGYRYIRAGNQEKHKRMMLSALGASILFLINYVIYHINVGSVPYPHHDWTRILYYSILLPHVLLATINLPFIIILVTFALKGEYQRHRRLAHWVWPSWMFVSVTGIIVYLMLYHL